MFYWIKTLYSKFMKWKIVKPSIFLCFNHILWELVKQTDNSSYSWQWNLFMSTIDENLMRMCFHLSMYIYTKIIFHRVLVRVLHGHNFSYRIQLSIRKEEGEKIIFVLYFIINFLLTTTRENIGKMFYSPSLCYFLS